MSTQNITCPKCGEVFALTDAAYVDIVGQVKNATFEKELHERVAAAQKLAEKDAELARQKADQAAASEITKLKAELDAAKSLTKSAVETAEAKAKAELVELRAKIDAAETQKQLAVTQAVSTVEKTAAAEVQAAKEKAAKSEQFAQLEKERFEAEIARLKDHRLALSTQGIGAEFEKWCENEFNKLRAGAFRNAYFERDNEVKEGGKGDYIFRENATSGSEIISIMFEMKNQADESVNTKKNTDFLEKLHKDRVKKGCEYAILVTTLEPDNELYNTGIVDMSHVHEKMFVIRPQFFIPLTILLRNAALDTVTFKDQVAHMRAQNVEVTAFEAALGKFKKDFGTNFKNAASNFDDAILEIDKIIKSLNNLKGDLELTRKHLGWANDKAENLTIKSLTAASPSLRLAFDEARANAPIEGEVVDHDDE